MLTDRKGVVDSLAVLNSTFDTGWQPAEIAVPNPDITKPGDITEPEVWTKTGVLALSIPGDQTFRYKVSVKFKLTQDAVTKYFDVVSSAYTTETAIVLDGHGVYSLSDSAISDCFYSIHTQPVGWPFIIPAALIPTTFINQTGWIPFSLNGSPLTITRNGVSPSGIVIAGADYTSELQKGYGIRILQNLVTKYFYITAVPTFSTDTIVTGLIGNDAAGNVVTIEDTSLYPITNACWTPNPSAAFGFPNGGWLNWVPGAYSCTGTMTYTSVTTILAKFRMSGNEVMVKHKSTGTTGGTASYGIIVPLPIAPNFTDSRYTGGASITDGSAISGTWRVTAGGILYYNNSGGLLGIGTVEVGSSEISYLA
jgi:hypothetical protein